MFFLILANYMHTTSHFAVYKTKTMYLKVLELGQAFLFPTPLPPSSPPTSQLASHLRLFP